MEETELEQYDFRAISDAQKQSAAAKVTKAINIAGFCIALWVLIMPVPYAVAIISITLLPVLAIGVLKYFKGMVRLDDYKSPLSFPSITFALICSAAIAIRACFDFTVYNHNYVWIPVFMLALSMLAVVLYGNKELRAMVPIKRAGLSFILFIVFLCYSYGVLVVMNCYFDMSRPEVFEARVLDKYVNAGKRNAAKTYYLRLTRWGKQEEGARVRVTNEKYARTTVNSKINIYYRHGLLGIPWFEVK